MYDVLRMVAGLGKGALLAKFDVENAYCNVPGHPDDRAKLGMKWRKQLYALRHLFLTTSRKWWNGFYQQTIQSLTSYTTWTIFYPRSLKFANVREQSVEIKECFR